MTNEQAATLIRSVFNRLNYKFFENGDFDVNLIGLRADRVYDNTFDDTFLAVYKNGGRWQMPRWLFTSEPGRTSLRDAANKDGCAILVPGQHRSAYTFGDHKGKYECLVPRRTLPVWRDIDRDLDFEPDHIVHDGNAIQIHKAGANSVNVDSWSEGCQVFKRADEFEALLTVCKRQPGDPIFTYTLVDLREVPELSPLSLNG